MATDSTHRTTRNLLARLPRTCTREDVQYRLYVLQTLERGRREIADGRGTPHAEVARKLRRKWRVKAGE